MECTKDAEMQYLSRRQSAKGDTLKQKNKQKSSPGNFHTRTFSGSNVLIGLGQCALKEPLFPETVFPFESQTPNF